MMGIRAVAFDVAAVALVRRRAIGGDFALKIRLLARQVNARSDIATRPFAFCKRNRSCGNVPSD